MLLTVYIYKKGKIIMKLRICESNGQTRIDPKLRRKLNSIAQRYSKYLYPEELRGFYDEVSELGITIPMFDAYSGDNHPYLLNGEEVTNSYFVFQKYEGKEKDEYNMYFS